MKLNVLLAAAGIALASAAHATDLYKGSAPQPIAFTDTWTGFYVGVGVGGDFARHDLNAAGFVSGGLGGDGVNGSVLVGYDRQFGHLVVSLEGDFTYSNQSTAVSIGGTGANIDLQYDWSVSARAGILLDQSTLVYGRAGFTEATFAPGGLIASIGSQTFNGYEVGGGLEKQLGAGFALRVEYLYKEYDSKTVWSSGSFAVTDAPVVQSVRAAVTYKLGGASLPLN